MNLATDARGAATQLLGAGLEYALEVMPAAQRDPQQATAWSQRTGRPSEDLLIPWGTVKTTPGAQQLTITLPPEAGY